MADSTIARAFDQAAGIYEQARPGWPAQALDHAVRELGLDQAATVLDLGAGTGKLTRLLVERFERVLAVEPLDGMRARLESLVPLAEALPGSAESIPLGATPSTPSFPPRRSTGSTACVRSPRSRECSARAADSF